MYVSNIYAVLSTAFGSVTFPTVIWLCREHSMAAMNLKHSLQIESPNWISKLNSQIESLLFWYIFSIFICKNSHLEVRTWLVVSIKIAPLGQIVRNHVGGGFPSLLPADQKRLWKMEIKNFTFCPNVLVQWILIETLSMYWFTSKWSTFKSSTYMMFKLHHVSHIFLSISQCSNIHASKY